MAKKHECPAGVPEWIVTYGDMMSLLLTFFILLVTLMEPKKETQSIQESITALQSGFLGGMGRLPLVDTPMAAIIKKFEHAVRNEKQKSKSKVEDHGLKGRTTTVTRIREGLLFTIGGLIAFEPGSAELQPEARESLASIAEAIRGHNNKIEIRGHTDGLELIEGGPYKTLWELSNARATVVMEFLTSREQGIRAQRIRLQACADNEPLLRRVVEKDRRAVNRRVELIVTERSVQDFEAPDDTPPESGR